MTVRYAQHYSKKTTPQSEAIPCEAQVQNNAGGYVYEIDKWARLNRFLVLGTDGGTYYVSEKKLTRENAQVVETCLAEDGRRTVDVIVAISDRGRASKNDPAIFALALAASVQKADATGCTAVDIRAHALAALPKVCRIPTHLFHFLEYCKALRRWSRMLRNAVAAWYRRWDANTLAFELAKYQTRDGWSNKDALRLSHAKLSAEHQAALRWAVGATTDTREVKRKNADGRIDRYGPKSGALSGSADALPPVIAAFEEAKTADTARLVTLIRDRGLTREMLPTEALNSVGVWEALLDKMPLTALVRNLAKMTSVGLLAPLSNAATTVTARLGDANYIAKSRLHPMAILNALRVYQSGHGDKGSLTWEPVGQVADALDAAFYLAFGNVTPTNQKIMLALDVSGSMDAAIAGTGLSCREAAAALALVTMNVEPNRLVVGFCAGASRYPTAIKELAISPRQRLDDVVRYLDSLQFGGTDCALPMLYASKQSLDVDAFVIFTDSETWAGEIHPSQALRDFRQKRNKPHAASVVVGMTASNFTIADPTDPRSLDVVGFDLATPQAISEFIGGAA